MLDGDRARPQGQSLDKRADIVDKCIKDKMGAAAKPADKPAAQANTAAAPAPAPKPRPSPAPPKT